MKTSLTLDLPMLSPSERDPLLLALNQGYFIMFDENHDELVNFYMAFRFLNRQPAILVSPEFAGDRLIMVSVRSRPIWKHLLRTVSMLDCMDLDVDQRDLTLSLAVPSEVAAQAASTIWNESAGGAPITEESVCPIETLMDEPGGSCHVSENGWLIQ